jgi:MoxR-like ATPase
MEGTYPLPEAQIDRFFFKLKINFPDQEDLHEIISKTTED